jgi:hypothetical protein
MFATGCTVLCKVNRVLVLRKYTAEQLACPLEELENEM